MQAAAGAFAALVIFALYYLLPVKDWTIAFGRLMEAHGPWGLVVFALVYILGVVLLVPSSLMTVAAGLAFGVAKGFPLVVCAATIGAALAFLLSRHLVHETVARFVAHRPKMEAVNTVISEGGWKVVGLLRLSPLLPFSLQNYVYGVTDVRFSHYVVATLVGTMPSKLLYVFVGAAGKAAAGGIDGRFRLTFIVVGLIVTIATALFVARRAATQLRKRGVPAA